MSVSPGQRFPSGLRTRPVSFGITGGNSLMEAHALVLPLLSAMLCCAASAPLATADDFTKSREENVGGLRVVLLAVSREEL